jgi:hypothetical protein
MRARNGIELLCDIAAYSIAKREIKAFPIVQIAGPLQSRPQIHPIERAGWHYMR